MTEDDTPPQCCPCGQRRQLTWSYLWSQWLCPSCLWNRTDKLLSETVTVLPVGTA